MGDESPHITLDMATLADTIYTLRCSTEKSDLPTPAIETSVKIASPTPTPTSIPIPSASTDQPPPAHDGYAFNSLAPNKPSTKHLTDRQDVLIATMLTRFAQLIKIAMTPEDENATLESQAANSLLLEVELQALVRLYLYRLL